MPETYSDTHESAEFSVAQARQIVRDLFEPRPAVYWIDFLLTMSIGYIGLALLAGAADLGPWHIVGAITGYVVAVLAFYRAVSFTHELVHLKGAAFNSFRVVWNLLCGIPFMVPSFTYYTHVEHHAKRTYGTASDGEYLPLARQPWWAVVAYLMQPWFVPPVLMLRFLVLAPLGWLIPPFRRWLHAHASSLIMDPEYIRPLPTNKELQVWRIQEVATFLVVATVMLAIYNGWVPSQIVVRYYLMGVGLVYLNHVRTMGAHRFVHTGRELTFLEQLLDSLNYPERPWLTCLWAPVGLRYHALHHLFPAMPYHALDAAHHRLMAQLPPDSPYRQTKSPGLLHALRELMSQSLAHSRQRPPSADAPPQPRSPRQRVTSASIS
ncbi:MAG: fatty acid desaturase [Planctomycetaceae bacterium]|nr:fatty acid desaturase [Planctomycetaceae bacterium]